MNIVDLYKTVPPENHRDIIFDAVNHVFYGGKEYVMSGDERELMLIHDEGAIQSKMDAIVTKTGAALSSGATR